MNNGLDPHPYWVSDGSTQEAWLKASASDRAYALNQAEYSFNVALGYAWGRQDADGRNDQQETYRFAAFRRIEQLRWALLMPSSGRPIPAEWNDWREHGGTVFSYHERGQAALTWFWVDRDGTRLRFGTEESAKRARSLTIDEGSRETRTPLKFPGFPTIYGVGEPIEGVDASQ